MRQLFVAALACALAACTGSGGGGVASAGSAPLERTTIDEKAVTLAASTVDALALSVSALSKTPLLQPGTPTAQRVARALDTARDGVNAAEAARQAGSQTSYAAALARAQEAIAAVKTALAGMGG